MTILFLVFWGSAHGVCTCLFDFRYLGSAIPIAIPIGFIKDFYRSDKYSIFMSFMVLTYEIDPGSSKINFLMKFCVWGLMFTYF